MRKYRSYKFTNKKHSQGGIKSSISGVIALVCTLTALYCAYVAKGNAGNYLALFGTVGIAASIYGIFVGNKSFREEECYYFFSKLGTFLNLLLLIFWIAVAAVGFLI